MKSTEKMRSTWLGLLFFVVIHEATSEDTSQVAVREKRQLNSFIPLVFPYGATYKLLSGISCPIHDVGDINMAFVANFQFQYLQFTNNTEISQYYVIKDVSREERDTWRSRRNERAFFYSSFISLLQSKGFNGYDCVLRAICEAAQYPMEEEGLIGELIHILMTPDYGHSSLDKSDPEWEESMAQYIDAAVAGRQMFDCGYIYNGCPEGQGILELISHLRAE